MLEWSVKEFEISLSRLKQMSLTCAKQPAMLLRIFWAFLMIRCPSFLVILVLSEPATCTNCWRAIGWPLDDPWMTLGWPLDHFRFKMSLKESGWRGKRCPWGRQNRKLLCAVSWVSVLCQCFASALPMLCQCFANVSRPNETWRLPSNEMLDVRSEDLPEVPSDSLNFLWTSGGSLDQATWRWGGECFISNGRVWCEMINGKNGSKDAICWTYFMCRGGASPGCNMVSLHVCQAPGQPEHDLSGPEALGTPFWIQNDMHKETVNYMETYKFDMQIAYIHDIHNIT